MMPMLRGHRLITYFCVLVGLGQFVRDNLHVWSVLMTLRLKRVPVVMLTVKHRVR